jgi:hypothetical protein
VINTSKFLKNNVSSSGSTILYIKGAIPDTRMKEYDPKEMRLLVGQ